MVLESKSLRKASARHRMSAILETLEERQLFSLVGIGAELGLPATSILGAGAGAVNYNAGTHAFTITGAPVSMIVDAVTTVPVNAPSGFTITLTVDNAGNATSGATPSTDVTLSGTVTIGSTTYTGTLLTGSIEAFGYQNGAGSGVDNFDFQFHVTGGQLAPTYFVGSDIGVVLADENSNFADFTTSFSATPVKGYVGSVPQGGGSAPISISGHKYIDQTGNGLSADDTTHPLANVTIQLYKDVNGTGVYAANDTLVTSQLTGADGSYSFTGLTAGTYFVKEVQVFGYVETGPEAGPVPGVYTVAATSGPYTGFDFDNYKLPGGCNCGCGCGSNLTTDLGSLSGTVFVDCNANGVKDYSEAGISGVKITLTGTDLLGNSVYKTLTTDSYGNYKFSGLVAGNYTITETQPTGYTDGKDSAGSLGGTLGNDTVANITLPPCGNGTGYNFGEVKTTSVCGNSGHGNCKVNLCGFDSWGRSCTWTTTTDCNGNYSFKNICDGNYKVQECDSRSNYCSTKNFCLDVKSCSSSGFDVRNCSNNYSSQNLFSQLCSWLGCWF